MSKLFYDFHVHSCLSPCAEDDMTPGNIVGMALVKNLDIVALTDHNTCKNVPAFMEIAKEYGIIAIPGMELCTVEDVHLIGLFPSLKDAMEFDEFVYDKMANIENKEEIFGNQLIYDKKDQFVGKEAKLLIGGTSISFMQAQDRILEHNGIMIPAHIDRTSNSLLSNLAFIPEDSSFSCVEIKNRKKKEEIISKNPYLNKCKILYNSDAHYLYEINEAKYYIETTGKTIPDIFAALSC